MGLALSIFFGFVPMFLFAAIIYWLDRYEKEPRILLGVVFLWGAVVAAGIAFVVNTGLGMGVYLFTQSEVATELTTGSIFAPVVEETLKGLAVLLVFLIFRREFDSVLDGIVYAAICAMGFAATENVYYIYTYGYMEEGMQGLWFMVFVRVLLVGWQHPFYTAFIGIGLATARLNRSWAVKLGAPLLGWFAAVSLHGLHNTLSSILGSAAGRIISLLWDWAGWFVMFLFILYMIYREQQNVRAQLHEEVALGNLNLAQYNTACSAWSQTGARLSALTSGSYRDTARFYQLCGELSHKKNQFARMGDESGNAQIITALRGELRTLSERINARALSKAT